MDRERREWERRVTPDRRSTLQSATDTKARGEFVEEVYTEDGKTFEEDGRDSARMLGLVMIIAAAFFLAVAGMLVWSVLT